MKIFLLATPSVTQRLIFVIQLFFLNFIFIIIIFLSLYLKKLSEKFNRKNLSSIAPTNFSQYTCNTPIPYCNMLDSFDIYNFSKCYRYYF